MEEIISRMREATAAAAHALEEVVAQRDAALNKEAQAAKVALEAMEAAQKYEALESLVNTPQIEDFLSGVRLEAAHQVLRWSEDNDRSKSAENWLFLVGYLAAKACRAQIEGNREKALHHTISSAAALMHWHSFIRQDDTCIGLGADEDLEALCDKFGLGLSSIYRCYKVGTEGDELYIARNVGDLSQWLSTVPGFENGIGAITEVSVMEKVFEGPGSERECTILRATVTRLLGGDVPPFQLVTRFA